MESVVFEETAIESTFDWIKHWIVHFMNGILNQQKNHFSIDEYISSFKRRERLTCFDCKAVYITYNLLENNTHCILFA